MTKEAQENVCSDPTQSLTVALPCQLVERIERYAGENVSNVDGVLIEALDSFCGRCNVKIQGMELIVEHVGSE